MNLWVARLDGAQVFPRLNPDPRRQGNLAVGLFAAGLLATNDAGFHYEGNLFERGDVIEWIARDGDDVCLITGLECTELILPAEEFCAVQCAGLESRPAEDIPYSTIRINSRACVP